MPPAAGTGTEPLLVRAGAPWIEKYRPKHVDEIAYQDDVVRTLKKSLETGNLPHLLFYGPPGTGKTSTILAIAKMLYGPELLKQRVMELNASDERGINVVRKKVKNFAQIAVGNQTSPGYPCPPYKLIILDEADSMTPDAQAALRRTMETYSKITRFCLICNYISRIIDPLASRCAKFRFKPLESGTVIERLRHISDMEQLPASDSTLQTIVNVSDGDMRKAIMYLQSAARLQGNNISSEGVIDIAGVIPKTVIEDLLKTACSNSFDKLQAFVTNITAAGYPIIQILSQVHDTIANDSSITDTQKADIAERLADVDKKLVDGADESLQFLDVAAFMMRVLCRTC
eukprot:CAMPEP_0184674466 /NCGR_PEP_ID=MMETSP0308-20130426/87252_1 /TAXON_ID=38269 /ORGANISM="Gloeochaete witrockiana, Strain SAG 46.84" /LENGTH=343 /DNA_ID=CAMNT_0027122067 /DNA_START=38 /DNA_END=1069 /DNA_ORIENTATION=-